MGSLLDTIDFGEVRDGLRQAKPMQFVPCLSTASAGLDKYGFTTLREFVVAHIIDGGLGIPLEKAKWLIDFNPAYKHQAAELKALLGIGELAATTLPVVEQGLGNERGVNQHSRILDNSKKVKHPNPPSSQGGNAAKYRIAKLKRDHPDIAERMANGEFKSVSEAERAAGVKPELEPKSRLTLPTNDKAKAIEMFELWLAKQYPE